MGAVELGCGVAGGDQRFGGERGQQRLQVRVFRRAEQGLRLQRNGGAGLAFTADAGLDLGVEHHAVGDAVFGHAPVGRDRLARVILRVPRPGVEQGELVPGLGGDAPTPVRAAVGGVVVHQEQRAVAGELDVNLGGAIAERNAVADRGQRVLGRQFAGATVGDGFGVGPGGEIHGRSLVRPCTVGVALPRPATDHRGGRGRAAPALASR